MKAWQAAIEVLKETDNLAVMQGDTGLLHMIAERCGMKACGYKTEKKVLDALTNNPGTLVAGKTCVARNRAVRIFRLPTSPTTSPAD